MSDERTVLRHALATIAYRASKALRGAPADFGGFRSGEGSRTPMEILAHMGDLMEWGLHHAQGEPRWEPVTSTTWEEGLDRFFDALGDFDAYLASNDPLGLPVDKLFQGPVADTLTHVGQINLLRRMAGSPVRGENYLKASIRVGDVGSEQAPPAWEFD